MKGSVIDFAIKVRLPLVIFVALCAFATTYFVAREERYSIGYQPDQPINFSHKLHAGDMDIDCRYCHSTVEKTRHANIPDPGTCMGCHSVARTDRPEIVKLTDYYRNKKPIPWVRIHKLPEHVYFDHSVHVNRNISCFACHGQITEMEKVSQVKPFTMASCLECHRTAHKNVDQSKTALIKNIGSESFDVKNINIKNGPEHCAACHR